MTGSGAIPDVGSSDSSITALASFYNSSSSGPLANLNSSSELYNTVVPSEIQGQHSPPNSNSRGDYVTTRYETSDPTYTIPLGYTQTEAYGDGVVLVGPTSWTTQFVLPLVEVANDLSKTSSAPQPWDPAPFFSGDNRTKITGKVSFISYGRDTACTSAFLSYAVSNPWITYTFPSAGPITLPNGQTTVTVFYSTVTNPRTSAPHCCGVCSIYFDHLQMLYWPSPHPNTACLGKMSADLNSTATSAGTVAHNQSIYATESDGYVL